MNFTSAALSEGCIRQLYTQNRCEAKHPWVQILDFEQSEANEKEITMRISDGMHFIDCTLFGNYLISNNAIIQTKNATTVTTFRRFQGVKLIDYFSKIDENRITKLKIMIRKMSEFINLSELIGSPQEIHQFMMNSRTTPKENSEQTIKKNKFQRQGSTHKSENNNYIKIENVMDVQIPIIIPPPPSIANTKNTKKQIQSTPQLQHTQLNGNNSQNQSGGNDSLTLSQILSGKEGYLIARLVRFKSAKKQTKDGIMSVCYLGLVDKHNELIRVHLAGRLAMNNQKTLKKNKSYYIRGFDLVNLKNAGTQIRLKEKQYKIVQINNLQLTKHLPVDYYCWDHQHHDSEVESEFVDVIGVIDDIEQKATYTVDTKSVIRLVLRNKFKSIRISFWTDQMKNFQTFNLKKKEYIIVEDIRKKQGKYYDFSLESSLINLREFPFLQERFKDFLPEIVEEGPPQTIRELENLYKDDPNNSKLQVLKAYLVSFKDNKLIYHICDECKKKVQKNATQCQECGGQQLIYKYNCPLEFSDSTGSIVVVLFDAAAQKLMGKTANQVNDMSEEGIEHLFQALLYRYYLITVENRNQRIILRNIQSIDQNQEAALLKQNLQKISKLTEIW